MINKKSFTVVAVMALSFSTACYAGCFLGLFCHKSPAAGENKPSPPPVEQDFMFTGQSSQSQACSANLIQNKYSDIGYFIFDAEFNLSPTRFKLIDDEASSKPHMRSLIAQSYSPLTGTEFVRVNIDTLKNKVIDYSYQQKGGDGNDSNINCKINQGPSLQSAIADPLMESSSLTEKSEPSAASEAAVKVESSSQSAI